MILNTLLYYMWTSQGYLYGTVWGALWNLTCFIMKNQAHHHDQREILNTRMNL